MLRDVPVAVAVQIQIRSLKWAKISQDIPVSVLKKQSNNKLYITALTASSELDNAGTVYTAGQGLLDSLLDATNNYGGAWCADTGDTASWIKVSRIFAINLQLARIDHILN